MYVSLQAMCCIPGQSTKLLVTVDLITQIQFNVEILG